MSQREKVPILRLIGDHEPQAKGAFQNTEGHVEKSADNVKKEFYK